MVSKNNCLGKRKQKEYYNLGTKLRQFQGGDFAYLKEMAPGSNQGSKFQLGWKGPFELIKRLSDNLLHQTKTE
jgi:hypothetical protein